MSQSSGDTESNEQGGARFSEDLDSLGKGELDSAQSVPKQSLHGQDDARSYSLLDDVLGSTDPTGQLRHPSLNDFLSESAVGKALHLWLGTDHHSDKERLVRRLSRDVATLDSHINDQINKIIHHPRFQKLESAWRGVEYLVDLAEREYDPAGSELQIKLLNVTWGELEKDFDGAIEIEQSAIFRKVYENEFGTAGGKPFGVLIGDYSIKPGPNAGNPHNDFSILGYLSQVAAASFCPFITNASPELFELERFGDLVNSSLDHEHTFGRKDYMQWQSLREKEDARFIGLALPRVLMRKPYTESNDRVDGFRFKEQVRENESNGYLWGGAAFAFGGVIAKAFSRSGWLADVRGVQRNIDDGGLVTDLPLESFSTDGAGIAKKFSTDVVISDRLEKELSDVGFIPLCACYDSPFSAFYSVQSIQKSKVYDTEAATINARISSMIHTMLCVSRFAHYLKVIGRDMMGSFKEPEELEQALHNWITDYVTADVAADSETKARYPLREASVKVRKVPGKSGVFNSVFHLCPHYEIEGLSAGVRLITELS